MDGKQIKIQSDLPSSAAKGITFYSSVGTDIQTLVNTTQCTIAGSYCIQQSMSIQGQGTGVHTPLSFEVIMPEGPDTYYYTMSTFPLIGNMSVNVTNIKKNGSDPGLIEGTFSGTVGKRKNYAPVQATIPIIVRFLLPVTP
jgi:hypothetical protein